ncbi:MBL fold metallo-hydrolase [Methanobacterium spitsbergense]|uniref:MBL fold metallo-hydrolase n=1 Tax=Methanobacterium spitsbergense TaxID=2874285 RepID=A0A8T5UY92_9EURY|nr:MBL fold metallo-hydrolase [Methanobacterium spitsbergense]MBZ2165689.1 MBL fold metallo-hydrolase [Methanobacterium spitsbergense]
MKLICVNDNTAKFSSEFYAEHGLSILIENGDSKVLFDTGKTPEVLKHNMEQLNGFKNLKHVVLSHGHEDHTGGLSQVLNNSSPNIYLHKRAILPKYIMRNDNMEFIGISKISYADTKDKEKKLQPKLKLISKTIEIEPNIFIFAEISFFNDFEELDPSFFIEKNDNFLHDNFEDELVLVIKTQEGLVILSGCGHKGIVNTVSSVAKYFNENVYAVIGGTHLITANEDRIESTISELVKFDPKYLIFGHCTGFDALCKFKNRFKNKFQILESGKEIILP